VILRAVIEEARHQEQADATRARPRALWAREQHHDLRIGIRAEPLFAVEPPVIAFRRGRARQCADVGAAFLLGHELTALGQPAHVGLGQAVEIFRLEFLAAEIRQEFRTAVGDVDRATETELRLIEQEGEGVLGNDGILVRPAHDALADRHRVNAELSERRLLQFAIGRVIFDPLHIAAELVALMQYRHMPIRQPCAFVEVPAGKLAQPIEMRLDMTEQRIRQVDAQEVRQGRIGAVEIHPRGVGREQPGLIRARSGVVRSRKLEHS